MLYSRLEHKDRAREGISCIVHHKNIKYIRQRTAVNERILKIEIEMEERVNATLLVVYAPNED